MSGGCAEASRPIHVGLVRCDSCKCDVPETKFDWARLECRDCATRGSPQGRNFDIFVPVPPKQSFPTGAVRDRDDGKVQLDLIPFEYLERVAWHYQNNICKYGRDNWRKGIPARRCLQSLLRHTSAVVQGKDDEDHLSAIVFNVFCIMHAQMAFADDKTINDLPGYAIGQETSPSPA
jgi:hypothetical protein